MRCHRVNGVTSVTQSGMYYADSEFLLFPARLVVQFFIVDIISTFQSITHSSMTVICTPDSF
jgi:hypothetical protein